MQKIKYGVLDKLLRADLSRAEMDFILHISHYQDDTGCVSGIYYRDICEALQISYQTFYDVLRSLQAKEIKPFTETGMLRYWTIHSRMELPVM